MSTYRHFPHDEFEKRLDQSLVLSCRAVQARVADMLEAILSAQFDAARVPAEQREQVRETIAHRLMLVERRALVEVEALRRERGDKVALDDWEQRARLTILTQLTALFAELGLDGDDDALGGVSPAPAPEPSPGGARATVPLGSVREIRMAPRPHPDYLGNREDVRSVAWALAHANAQWRLGSFSGVGLSIEDIADSAAANAVGRYERGWDPERGSLFAYLALLVSQAVGLEYRRACAAKAQEAQTTEHETAVLAQELRVRSADTGENPLWADGLFALERSDLPYLEAVRRCLPLLSAAHREEVERYLREGTSGTEQQRSVRRRAFANLREWSADHLDQAL